MNVIELFAGAGGLALGLEMAGFDTKCVVESNSWAVKTLIKNRPNWNVIEEDIVLMAEKGLKTYINLEEDIDLISGGFPCQAFSYAGKKLGLNDVRGTLFYSFAKIVNDIKPKMFLAENVKGLTSHDKGKTLKTIIDVFNSIGYEIDYKVLNSLNYEVAQKRERVIIVGVRKELKQELGVYKFPTKIDKTLTLKDILQNTPPSPCASYSKTKKEVLKLIPQGGCWRDLEESIAKEYMGKSYYLGGGKTGIARRLSWDEPSLTILCSPSQKQTERCHPNELRPLSIRESARIQSFPDEWSFEGPLTEQYKQIGNSVPVNFAKHIGLSIKNYITKREYIKVKNEQLQFNFY